MKNLNFNTQQAYHPYQQQYRQQPPNHQQQPQQQQTQQQQFNNNLNQQSATQQQQQQQLPTLPSYQQSKISRHNFNSSTSSTVSATPRPTSLSLAAQMSSSLSATNYHLHSPTNQYNNPNYLNYSNSNRNLPPFSNNSINLQKHQLQQTLQQQLPLQQPQFTQQQTQPQFALPRLSYHPQQQQPQRQRVVPSSLSLAAPVAAQSLVSTGSGGGGVGDKFAMDACEIANFLANELFMQQLVSVDGIQSGVPTLTTSTLTPTTLRSIEETFIQLTSEPMNAPYQAGFIPPPLGPFPSATQSTNAPTTVFNDSIHDFNDANDTESEDSQGSWNGAQLNEENSLATTDTSSAATDSTSFQNGLNGMGNNSLATSNASSTNDFTAVIAAAASAAKNNLTSNSATPTTTRRNQGGRRPNKSANMSPEEEEKRRIRRERNKLAAARCRKRRVDQTNELLEEVAVLEKRREGLQKDIESLNTTKQELEYILEAHRPTCQKIRQDMLSVSTYGGLIAPTTTASSTTNRSGGTITGLDTTLSSTGRSGSPLDLKPVLLHPSDNNMHMDVHIKHEPLDTTLDSNSSLDHDDHGPPSPKRLLLASSSNPMIPPPLPNVATLSASLAAAASAASASLNTPIMTTAPVSFSNFGSFSSNSATLNTLNSLNALHHRPNSKQRPNTLPTMPRHLGQSLALQVDNNGKPLTDINGVAIQTPSTGMFNFDSLMDGGTGLTPVSGPLVPTCSSQTNKHPLELTTPTSEPSKLVSL